MAGFDLKWDCTVDLIMDSARGQVLE
ncbi:hypothetical protein CCACVL1_20038 [Corchorus capsularis]|uniref:Uncharacterized protein n=1 Tax=Corchorus capsularis TaxID=210143 RepID=A0A1R3HD50_COCAP|nr:hypothetical protein CCACVL1_20038 [Corchorus capsularis]